MRIYTVEFQGNVFNKDNTQHPVEFYSTYKKAENSIKKKILKQHIELDIESGQKAMFQLKPPVFKGMIGPEFAYIGWIDVK